jgi:hypothetical protein
MGPERQAVHDLAAQVLGPGKLRILDDGEFHWIADDGVRTHLGWNLTVAMEKLRSMVDESIRPPPSDRPEH